MVKLLNERRNQLLTLFLLILIGFFVFYLFQSAFSAYFFQDDWFSLSISYAQNITDLVRFFLPVKNVIYYRPLGMQIPFFIVRTFFGINPLPFRIATYLIHLTNGFLVFKLLHFFLKNKKISLVGSFLYLTSSSHIIIFFWAATFSFVLASFFYFGSFWFYIKGKSKTSFILFTIGLLTNELLITLPIILLCWEFIQKNKNLKNLLYFLAVSIIYVILRKIFIPLPKSEGYTLLTDLTQLFINLRNYFLWSFNWADEINNQFVSFFRLNPLFIKDFGQYVFTLIFAMFFFILFLIIFPVFLLFKNKNVNERLIYQVAFGILWFLVTLSPVLYFSKHYFSYYVPIPLFGLILVSLTFFQYSLKNNKTQTFNNIILIIIVLVWYISSLETIKLDLLIHWATQRSTRSKELISQVQKSYFQTEKNTLFIIPSDTGEKNKWALGDQEGLKVIFDDKNITTFYGTKTEYIQTLFRENDDIELKTRIIEIK